MKTKDVTLLALAVVLIGAAAALFVGSSGQESGDFPDGIKWICQAEGCGHGFTITHREHGKYVAARADSSEGYPCPECGATTTVRAAQCPSCLKYFEFSAIRGTTDPKCPYCEASLAADRE
jgi:predicted RNA-binding Zn-ribbon protein involved in translation (DUF1610 family)